MNHLHILQIPGFRFRAVSGARREIIHHNVVVGVLLKHLHVIECIAAREKILNEPGAQVRSIAKDLSLDIARGAHPRV